MVAVGEQHRLRPERFQSPDGVDSDRTELLVSDVRRRGNLVYELRCVPDCLSGDHNAPSSRLHEECQMTGRVPRCSQDRDPFGNGHVIVDQSALALRRRRPLGNGVGGLVLDCVDLGRPMKKGTSVP